MDFIPLASYGFVYFNFLLVISLYMFIDAYRVSLTYKQNVQAKNILGVFILVVITFYIGLRPLSGRYFGDMGTYSLQFQRYQTGNALLFKQDIGFDYYMIICSKLLSLKAFFLVSAMFYILPLYFACKKWFKQYWFYAFFALITSFSFLAYGTNGIRNGMATSLVLLAFAYWDKKWFSIVVLLIAASFHRSVTLPIIAFLFALYYNNTNKVLYFWLLCIPLSVISGGFFENFFGKLGFDDSRLNYLTQGNVNNDNFSSTGFRWDFLLYSSIGTFAGWYFVIKRGYRDKVFQVLVNTYLIANGFWILIIRANFSNRFAYLSWFMLGIVIVFPLLKKIFFKEQHRILMSVLVLYFIFTYMLNVVLAK